MNHNDTASPLAWSLALAAAAILGTFIAACMMPFVAITALAAATMSRQRAIATVVGIWAVNQLLGFGLLGYPMTAYAIAWGVALGVASLIALLVARRVVCRTTLTPTTLVVGFAAAFAAYEIFLFTFALVAGGTGTFTPSIVLRILANDLAWLAGMSALHFVLARTVPNVFGIRAALRTA